MENIYTVTMIRGLNEIPGSVFSNDIRCVGFFWDIDDAIKCALFDEMMWEEGYYRYCCIEEMQQGLYFITFDQIWIDTMGNCIETPTAYQSLCNFGIG